MSEPAAIVIVGSRAWRPQVREAFRDLDAGQKNLAGAVLRYLHDIHVGMTPELAAGLARAMSGHARQRAAAGPWTRVFERLAGELVPAGGARRSDRRRYAGMAPGAAPFYTVARIAAPLVARAAEGLDAVYLFAADPDPCPEGFGERYRRYSARLGSRVAALASSDALSEIFWTDRALTLSRLSRSAPAGPPAAKVAAAPAMTAGGMPEVDTVALGQLLRLEPELPGPPRLGRSLPRRLTSSPRFRPLLNRNQEGVDGIFQTRRLADLPGMLVSELLNPRPLLFERLLHSGYMALRRPPLYEKQRDVLVAGLVPPASPGAPSTMKRGLVKAAWFDAVTRLSVWLRRAGLTRSELLWIEPDPLGRRRECRAFLEDLPEGLPATGGSTAARRKELLAALGWLPDFVELRANGLETRSVAEPLDWSAAAWKGVEDHVRWREKGRADEPPPPLDREAFDTVHLMLFLPRKLEKSTSVGRLRHAFGLPAESGHSVSVTWTPEDFTDVGAETGWALSVEMKPTRPVMKKEVDIDGRFENRLAGALIDAWLETISELLLRP